MSVFDKTCIKYYVKKVDQTDVGLNRLYGGVLIVPYGENFDGIVYSPFSGTFYSNGQMGLEDGTVAYITAWYSDLTINGSLSYYPKRYDVLSVGDMVGNFFGNMWALYIYTPTRSDVEKIHALFPEEGWVENTDYAQKGKSVIISMDTVNTTGVSTVINREVYNTGDTVNPSHASDNNIRTWKGWSTTWPEFTEYDGIANEGVTYLYGIWEGESERLDLTCYSGDNNFLKNQENIKQSVQVVKGTMAVPMALTFTDTKDLGKFFIFLGFGGYRFGANFGPTYNPYIAPILTFNPDNVDISALFTYSIKIFTNLKKGTYETYNADVEPYPESIDLLFSQPNSAGLSVGTESWKTQSGCYWYYSGKYKQDGDIIPILTALSSHYNRAATFYKWPDVFTKGMK